MPFGFLQTFNQGIGLEVIAIARRDAALESLPGGASGLHPLQQVLQLRRAVNGNWWFSWPVREP